MSWYGLCVFWTSYYWYLVFGCPSGDMGLISLLMLTKQGNLLLDRPTIYESQACKGNASIQLVIFGTTSQSTGYSCWRTKVNTFGKYATSQSILGSTTTLLTLPTLISKIGQWEHNLFALFFCATRKFESSINTCSMILSWLYILQSVSIMWVRTSLTTLRFSLLLEPPSKLELCSCCLVSWAGCSTFTAPESFWRVLLLSSSSKWWSWCRWALTQWLIYLASRLVALIGKTT